MKRLAKWLGLVGVIALLLTAGVKAKQSTQAQDDADTSVTSYFDSTVSDSDLSHSGGSDTTSASYKNGAAMMSAAQGVYPALEFESVTSSKMRTTSDGVSQAIDPTAELTFTIKKGTTTPNPFPSGLNDIGQIILVFSFPNSVSGKSSPVQYLATDSKAVTINGNQTGVITVGNNADVSENDKEFTVTRDLNVTVNLEEATQELANKNGVSVSQVTPKQVVVSQQFGVRNVGDNWYKVKMGTLSFTLTLTPEVSSIIVLPDTPLAKKLFGDDTYAVVIGKGALSGDSIYYSTSDLDPNAAVGSGSWQATGVTVGKNGTWVWRVPKGVMSAADSKLYFTERSNNASDTSGADDGAGTDPFAGLTAAQTETGLNHLHDVTDTLNDPNSDPEDVDQALTDLNDVLNPDTSGGDETTNPPDTNPTDSPDEPDSDTKDSDFSLDIWRENDEAKFADTVKNVMFMPVGNGDNDVTDSMTIGVVHNEWGYLGDNTYVQTQEMNSRIPTAKWTELKADGSDYPEVAKYPVTITPIGSKDDSLTGSHDGSLNADLTVNPTNLTADDYKNGLTVKIKLTFVDATNQIRSMTRTIHLLAITPSNLQVDSEQNGSFELNDGGVQSLTDATYNWQFEGKSGWSSVPGGDGNSLNLTNLTAANSGDRYRLQIVDDGITYTSSPSTVTVSSPTGITSVPDFAFKLNGQDPSLEQLVGSPTTGLTANGGKLSFQYGASNAWVLDVQLSNFINQTDQSIAKGDIGLNLEFIPDSDSRYSSTTALPNKDKTCYAGDSPVDFFSDDGNNSGAKLSGSVSAMMGMANMTQLEAGDYDATITWTLGMRDTGIEQPAR